MLKLIFVLFCVLFFLNLTESKRDYYFDVIDHNITIYKTRYADWFYMTIYKGERITYLYCEFRLKKEVPKFMARMSLDMFRKDKTRISLLKLDVDGCKFILGQYNSISLVQVILTEFNRVSNVPRKCPIPGGVDFVVNNYTLDAEQYPVFAPSMTWLVKFEFWIGRAHEADVFIKGRIVK